MSFVDELLTAQSYLLFDHDFIDPKQPTGLWFCRDAEEVYAAQINAVALGSDSEWRDIRKCERFLKAFPYIFVAAAQKEIQEQISGKLRELLPELSIYVPGPSAFRGCHTVREFRDQYGASRMQELLLNARELPVYGLINIADIEPRRLEDLRRTRSGIPELDQFTGGFYGGQLSLWTGERGKGKSTLLGQILLEAIEENAVVCAYSGELDKHQFKQWVSIQAAGPSHVGVFDDKVTGRKISTIATSVQRRIDEWWDRRFFLYDVGTASSHSEESILSTFENANRCYGASVFLVDNVMTIGLRSSREGDYFRAQSNFAGRLVQFAKQHGVHVHLVAHPRKADSGRKHLTADDIGGSGDLPNRADNVFSLETDKQEVRGQMEEVTVLSCLKNRMFGGRKRIALKFDIKSRRFYRPGSEPDRVYGWERVGKQIEITEISDSGDDPWKEGSSGQEG